MHLGILVNNPKYGVERRGFYMHRLALSRTILYIYMADTERIINVQIHSLELKKTGKVQAANLNRVVNINVILPAI